VIFREPTAYLKRLIDETGKAHLFRINHASKIINSLKFENDFYELAICDYAPAKSILNMTLSRNSLGKTCFTAEIKEPEMPTIFKDFRFFYSNTGYSETFSF